MQADNSAVHLYIIKISKFYMIDWVEFNAPPDTV